MSAVEKILKKVEQDRSKGNFEKALQRLKEALVKAPHEFVLAKEAAELAFQLQRTLEGVSILRTAIRRCPRERAEVLEVARLEFATVRQLELAEFLYDAHLAESDFDQAREIVAELASSDLRKLLSKLRSKIQAVSDNVPGEVKRLVGLWLAEAIVLSGMQEPEEVAVSLNHVLDQSSEDTEIVGRLCKAELQLDHNCLPIRLLLARCYMKIQELDLAAEQFMAIGERADLRPKALAAMDRNVTAASLLLARAYLQLLENQFEEAHDTLRTVLATKPDAHSMVRQTLEKVDDAMHATDNLRQLYASTLAQSNQLHRAIEELRKAREANCSAETSAQTVDQFLIDDPKNVDLLILRSQLAMDSDDPKTTALHLSSLVSSHPKRAWELRDNLEKAYSAHGDCLELGLAWIDLLIANNEPSDATRVLQEIRSSGSLEAHQAYDRAGSIAGLFGFSAELLMLYVEYAVDIGKPADARAAVLHYFNTPGTRISDFVDQLKVVLEKRPELTTKLSQTFAGLEVSAELRLAFIHSKLHGHSPESAVRELQMLVQQEPDLLDKAIKTLQAFIHREADHVEALELTAILLVEAESWEEAAKTFAKTLTNDPSSTDRIVSRTNSLLTQCSTRDEVWRPIILALIDNQRFRHARDLVYRATQSIAPENQGFLHVANGCIYLESRQMAESAQFFEQAIDCADHLIDRVVEGMEQITRLDKHNGHARFVLSKALLKQGGNPENALIELTDALRLDKLLADQALELLRDHAEIFFENVQAHVLEGRLHLDKGDRIRGIEIMTEALSMSEEVPEDVLTALQNEWDHDQSDFTTGFAFARALHQAGHVLRASRIFDLLAQSFPEQQGLCIDALEGMLQNSDDIETRKMLLKLQLEQGDEESALKHTRQLAKQLHGDDETLRDFMESVRTRMPDVTWISCHLSEVLLRLGDAKRAVGILIEVFQHDPTQWKIVLDTLDPYVEKEDVTVELLLLQVDCLFQGKSWQIAHTTLLRIANRFPKSTGPIVARYRNLIDKGQTDFAADLDFALMQQELGETAEAMTVLENALKQLESLEPKNVELTQREHETRLCLATLYSDTGRESESKTLLASVLETSGDHKDTYRFLERVATQSLTARMRIIKETIDRSPNDWQARLDLAKLYLTSGHFKTARETLTFSGDSPIVEATRRYVLARTYAENDELQLAATVLQSINLEAISDSEIRSQSLYLQAYCNAQLGQFGKAHALYLQLLSEDPEYKDAHARVRAVYDKHLETTLQSSAMILEKRTSIEWSDDGQAQQ